VDVIQNQLTLALQQVQTISAEREVANTIGLQAQQDLVNLRLNFHEVVAEKNALLMEQGCLRETNSHKETQLDQLQTQLNNAITFQNETTTSLSEAKSSLEKTTTIVQTISAERDDAATLVQHSQNELANLRRNFDAVVSEKNALTTNETSLNQSINALQTQLNNSISLQEQTAGSLEKCKSSLDISTSRTLDLEKKLKKSERQAIDVAFKLQEATKLIQKKDEEFLIATKRFKDEISKERQRYVDLNISINESAQSLSLIQTGSEQLDQEFQNEMQKLISKGPSLMELLDIIQQLIAHINKKSSSDIDSLTTDLKLKSIVDSHETAIRLKNAFIQELNVNVYAKRRIILLN
jgi:hypothetical protein